MASGTSYDFRIPDVKPIRKLDDGAVSSGVNDLNKKACIPRMRSSSFPSQVPQSVMLGTLLEHLCQLFESDPKKASELFQTICKHLEKWEIVSPVAYLDEYASVRHQYKTSFYSLIQSSLSTINNKLSLPLPDNAKTMDQKKRKGSTFNLSPSRYLEEYEEVGSLGKGSYGSVFKVKNKIDGQEYAIKKVRIKRNGKHNEQLHIDRIMREVQSLAAMQHAGIVRYHNAWMEHQTVIHRTVEKDEVFSSLSESLHSSPSSGELNTNNSHSLAFKSSRENTDIGSSLSSVHLSNRGKLWNTSSSSSNESVDDIHSSTNGQEDSQYDGLQFLPDSSHQEANNEVIYSNGVLKKEKTIRRVQSVVLMASHPSISMSQSPSKLRVQSYNDLAKLALVKNEQVKQRQCFVLKDHFAANLSDEIILYIQMQLCEMPLTSWLSERNNSCAHSRSDQFEAVDEITSLDIAHQLFEALDYIHSKGIMHRDIKPRNILLNGTRPNVLLGDFGLARPAALYKQSSSLYLTPLSDVTEFMETEQTTGVGTMIYAAPEQLEGGEYGTKADLYAAGIVFYELLWPLQTQHERVDSISYLRKQQIPKEFSERWPKFVSTLQSLLSHDADQRPSANEILSGELFEEVSFNQFARLKAENAQLKQLVEKYEAKLQKHNISLD